MENKDRKNDFWDVVQDAVNSGNYQQLNQQVKSTIDDTVDGIRKGMQSVGGQVQKEVKNAGDEFRREMKNAKTEWKQAWQKSGYGAGYQKSQEPAYQPGKRQENRQADSETRPQAAAVYRKNPPGKVSGVVLAITGYSLTGIFVLSAIICGIVLAWVADPSGNGPHSFNDGTCRGISGNGNRRNGGSEKSDPVSGICKADWQQNVLYHRGAFSENGKRTSKSTSGSEKDD